jgi:hypothetical protein
MSETNSILEDPVAQLLLSGQAANPSAAEKLYLERNCDQVLAEILRLVDGPLSNAEFRRHPLVAMLVSHGSRDWEDSLG